MPPFSLWLSYVPGVSIFRDTDAKRSRCGLADMPPEVLMAILRAARPGEAAAAAALAATCHELRRTVLSCCIAAVELRQFGRDQQIAPLLGRLKGVRQILLGGCGWGAIPWLELKQLQHLRQLTLPHAPTAETMQPLTALQQLVTLRFTPCQHGTAAELPAASAAALRSLEVLDASGCAPFSAKGLQALSTLQHLEVLHVPCDDPHAIIRLAVQLPRLRSLDLRTSSSLGLQQDGRQLDVAAAAMLTELRLRVSTKDADLLQRMQIPPRLQVLDLSIVVYDEDRPDAIISTINALPLQHLASLSLLHPRENDPLLWVVHTAVQLPQALPRLRRLRFEQFREWDGVHRALWPLAVLTAQGASDRAAACGAPAASADFSPPQPVCSASGDEWRLQIMVRSLGYELSASDILQRCGVDGSNIIHGAMRGRLQRAHWSPHGSGLRTLDCIEGVSAAVDGMLTHETQLTRLTLHPAATGVAYRRTSPAAAHTMRSFASLPALRELRAPCMPRLAPGDCHAVAQLRHLTTLEFPDRLGEATQANMCACLRHLTSLRQLMGPLELSPDTLAALGPLTALTQLCLMGPTDIVGMSIWEQAVHSKAQRRLSHEWLKLRNMQLPLRQLHLRRSNTLDVTLVAALKHMPSLRELNVSQNSVLTGHGLKVLPGSCPLLRVLHLQQLPQLTGCFFPTLQQLASLDTLEVTECDLASEVPRAAATHMPRNLQTLALRRPVDTLEGPVGWETGFGMCVTGFLGSLPLLQAPIRWLSLQRGGATPITDEDLASLAAAAPQLSHLERLDLHCVQVSREGLQALVALSALAEVNAWVADTHVFGVHSQQDRENQALKAGLDDLKASFLSLGRHLVTDWQKERIA